MDFIGLMVFKVEIFLEQRAFPLSLTHLAPAPHGLGSHGSKDIKNIMNFVALI